MARTSSKNASASLKKAGVQPQNRRHWEPSTVIAAFALLISALQLVVTAPQIFQLLFGPKLTIEGYATDVSLDGPHSGTMSLKNTGWSTANKVEIGIRTGGSAKVSLYPDVAVNVRVDAKEGIFTSHRIELERLLPNETLTIHVADNEVNSRGAQIMRAMKNGLEEITKAVGSKHTATEVSTLPYVTFMRSSEGTWEAPKLQVRSKNPFTDLWDATR